MPRPAGYMPQLDSLRTFAVLLNFVLLLAVAWASWFLFEKPFIGLKRYFQLP